MKQTTFQHPELRDANDNIIQQGAFGKNTALANSTNDGWIDYVANDLEALYNNTMGGTGGEINTETITGKTGTITNLTATTVKAGTLTADALNGPLTGNVTGTADKAVADGDGNNIVNTYVTKSAIASSVTTATGKVTTLTATDSTLTNVTINGETSVPTANEGNSSKAIANTEFVQGELTNYLPLSGGTLTGVVNGVTPTAGDNSTKIATTEFVNAKAGNYLPLSGGTLTGDVDITGDLSVSGAITGSIQYVNNGKVFAIGNTTTGNVDLGWNWVNSEGAGLALRSTDFSSPGGSPGEFTLFARDANNTCSLTGNPGGSLTWNGQPLLPVGIVQAFAGTTIPSGWLLCDGSAVSRTDYAALYAVIGTTYGAGDGSTTFNLPNLIDKFVEGSAESGTVKSAGLPNITGSFIMELVNPSESANGAFNLAKGSPNNRGVSDGNTFTWGHVYIDASRSSSVYGKSTTVQPPALTMRYIIKY